MSHSISQILHEAKGLFPNNVTIRSISDLTATDLIVLREQLEEELSRLEMGPETILLANSLEELKKRARLWAKARELSARMKRMSEVGRGIHV